MEKRGIYVLYFAIFIFFSWCSWNTPLTGDDWTWQSQLGIDRLKDWFENYNGRYLSNIIEIVLVRFSWLRILFEGICSFALIYLISKVTFKKSSMATILISFILVLSISIRIYAQTFGWTAGYVNYVFSIVCILVYILVVKNIAEDEMPKYNKYLVYPIALLGFFSQLIVEHGTMFSVYTAILVVVWTKIKFKKIYAVHITYLIASIMGTIVMFSNSAYVNVLLGKDTYREVSDEPFMEKMIFMYENYISKYIFEINMWIVLFVTAVCILLWTQFKTKKLSMILIKFLSILYFYTYSIIVILVNVPSIKNNFIGSEGTLAIFSIIFYVFLVLAPLAIVKKSTRIYCWYFLTGVLLLSAPFIVISPYGPRCALASIIFLILFAMKILDYCCEKENYSLNRLIIPLSIIAIWSVIQLGAPLSENGKVDRERLAQIPIDLQENPKKLYIKSVPNRKYHWMANPGEKIYMTQFFKQVHNIPQETPIKITVEENQ